MSSHISIALENQLTSIMNRFTRLGDGAISLSLDHADSDVTKYNGIKISTSSIDKTVDEFLKEILEDSTPTQTQSSQFVAMGPTTESGNLRFAQEPTVNSHLTEIPQQLLYGVSF